MKRRLTGQAAVRYARYKTNSSAKAFANYSSSNYADEYLAECKRIDAQYQPGVRVRVKDYFPKATGCIGKIVRRVTKRKVAVILENAREHEFWLKQWQLSYAPASEDFLKFWDESAIYFELTELEIFSP